MTPPVAQIAPLVAGLQLAVLGGGVRMPIYQVVETQRSQTTPIVPARTPAPVPYVAPFHPPKQDRN